MRSAHKLNKLTMLLSCMLSGMAFHSQADATPPLSVLQQIQQLPADFVDHMFDVPLVVRVELNARYLGDAMIVLDRQENIQLLAFTDERDSEYGDEQRQRWLQRLAGKTALGNCKTQCDDVVALHYSLAESLFSIISSDARESVTQNRYYQLPAEGQHGVILQNQLSVSAGEQQETSGYYNARLTASHGNWTSSGAAQITRTGGQDNSTNTLLSELYSQREFAGDFLRLGLFSTHGGDLQLQPQYMASGTSTIAGMMYGSSSALETPGNTASATPVYVTANRPAVVEIFRDGYLLYTQQVGAGLQLIDTTKLPGGIYPVQIKVVEDGEVSSETEEMIYKPQGWTNPEQRLKYNVFVGQAQHQASSGSNADNSKVHAGAAVNYLLTPGMVLGAGINRQSEHTQLSLNTDWSLSDSNRLLFSTFYSDVYGHGFNTQLIYGMKNGSLILGHNQQQRRASDSQATTEHSTQQLSNTSVSLYQRLTSEHSVNLRLSRDTQNKYASDINWNFRQQVLGNDATWRFAAFNRPGNTGSGDKRQYGVELGVTINFGASANRFNAAVGNRTNRDGEREFSGQLGWNRQLQPGFFNAVGADLTLDSYGAGLSGYTGFQNQYMNGNGFINRSSFNGNLSGGMNLNSTVALGGGAVAATSQGLHATSGIIVDVQSDLPAIELQADNSRGGSMVLKPGKNFVPVSPYVSGRLSFSLAGSRADNVALSQSIVSYQLNQGAVKTVQLELHETVSVMGRLLDHNGQPLKGSHVINHASRTVSEVSGFFSVEMRKNSPTLDIVHHGELLCQINLAERLSEQQDNILLLGDLSLDCIDTLAQASNTLAAN